MSLSHPATSKATDMHLIHIIYASHHGGTSVSAVEDILMKSRANNIRDGITGALIVSEEDFVQLLEGDRTAVAKCFMRIMMDSRHQNIQVLFAGDAEQRLFQGWSMYAVNAFKIRKDILSRHMIDGSFNPAGMSGTAVREIYQLLSIRKAALSR